jgi:hypothetical protein
MPIDSLLGISIQDLTSLGGDGFRDYGSRGEGERAGRKGEERGGGIQLLRNITF